MNYKQILDLANNYAKYFIHLAQFDRTLPDTLEIEQNEHSKIKRTDCFNYAGTEFEHVYE